MTDTSVNVIKYHIHKVGSTQGKSTGLIFSRRKSTNLPNKYHSNITPGYCSLAGLM